MHEFLTPDNVRFPLLLTVCAASQSGPSDVSFCVNSIRRPNDSNVSGFRIAAFSIDRIQGYPVGASIGLKVTLWQSRCSEKPEAARRWLAPQLWPKDS
jgi:hypothetical protein